MKTLQKPAIWLGLAGLVAAVIFSAGNNPDKSSTVSAAVKNAESMPSVGAEALPSDFFEKLTNVSRDEREKLAGDPLLLAYLKSVQAQDRQPIVQEWLEGLKDNFCRSFLDTVASRAFDAEGLKKLDLAASKAKCPTGGSLDETITYVNKRLRESFDDPLYTVVFPPEKAKQVEEKMLGTGVLKGGVGLLFTVDQSRQLPPMPGAPSGQARYQFTGLIYHVAGGSPAAMAGIVDGDSLLKVDGEDVLGQDFEHVVNDLLIGKLDSKVTLTVKRGEETFERTLIRGKVKPDAVWLRSLGDGIFAVVVNKWLPETPETQDSAARPSTSSEIYTAVRKAEAMGARGYILDLRLNGGGVMDEAILASSFFVENGLLVISKERDGGNTGEPNYRTVNWERRNGQLYTVLQDEASGKTQEKRMLVELAVTDLSTGKSEMTKTDVPFLKGMPPMVVLGNGGTASASEIAIGALTKNHSADLDSCKFQGATFIGSPTFGKGIEQENGPGPLNTRISVTFGRYFLKDGSWPGDAGKHRNPLQPDVFVDEPAGAQLYTASDAQLNAAVELLKKQSCTASTPGR